MSDRKAYTNSVIPLPDQPNTEVNGLTVNSIAPPTDEMMTIHFSLEVPKGVVAQLENNVAAGKVSTPAEIEKLYQTKAADPKPLLSWLKDNDYDVKQAAAGGVYAQGQS